MEIDEVLDARMVVCGTGVVELAKDLGLDVEPLHRRLDDQFGLGVVLEVGAGADPSEDGLASVASTVPRRIWRSRLPATDARPWSRISASISVSTTSNPARAATWAMPQPI